MDEDVAQVIAAVVVGLLPLALASIGRLVWVTTAAVPEVRAGETPKRSLAKGVVIDPADVAHVAETSRRQVRRSWLAGILVGKDNQTSTSKTVAFVWTLAIVWGLLALLLELVFGDGNGWKAQEAKGELQEEYLLLLGGPYAAAVIAKYAAVQRSDSGSTTPAPVGNAETAQVVQDSRGDTDLGDFQYVAFNLIALLFFVSAFWGDLDAGFPDLPELLTGLALTSAGGYTLKKLVSESRPALRSVAPATAAPNARVTVYGTNLTVPPRVAGGAADLQPKVYVGSMLADLVAQDRLLDVERLTVEVPAGAAAGSAPITVIRADGVSATGPSGSDGIPFTVDAAAAPQAPAGMAAPPPAPPPAGTTAPPTPPPGGGGAMGGAPA